ncbi:processed acidic surface protein [Alkalihalobacterium bogoriense]|uniref:processed acidic surface protein n=1 Tax=Alkalihalobacterium bogoriense TaxID=246272 RepID=UPI0006869CC6|nr:processed acidic surface protein [Alkalihalobacterium bogoriense]
MKKVFILFLAILFVIPNLTVFAATPITDENLQELLDKYELTLVELEEMLAEYGDTLADYESIEELEEMIIFDAEFDEISLDDLTELFALFGLTEDELIRLLDHVSALDGETVLANLEALEARIMALPDFDSADDLTDAELEELASIWEELLRVFEMEAKYFLVKDGNKEAISLRDLIVLDSVDGADLLIELYNLQGEFLADILITSDMFGSDVIKEITEEATGAAPIQSDKTVKGGKLPKTATDHGLGMLFALMAVTVGFGLYRKGKALS